MSDCTCGHDREEHGDGYVHTSCCYMPGLLSTMCQCPEFKEAS